MHTGEPAELPKKGLSCGGLRRVFHAEARSVPASAGMVLRSVRAHAEYPTVHATGRGQGHSERDRGRMEREIGRERERERERERARERET